MLVRVGQSEPSPQLSTERTMHTGDLLLGNWAFLVKQWGGGMLLHGVTV